MGDGSRAGDERASREQDVKALYQNAEVAERYMDERLRHAWWRHLHDVQVRELNRVISAHRPQDILEIAPGPARLAPELRGVRRGLMVEASLEMLAIARERLRQAGVAGLWEVREGNAFDLSPLGRPFDFAYSFRLIRHFSPDERDRIYREVSGRVRPGGFFMFDVVNRNVREWLDAREGGGEGLKVFDATYTGAPDIAAELRPHGFELVSLTGVLNHFGLQSTLSYKLDDRLFDPVLALIRLLDRIPSRHPLEWVALFRKV